MSCGCLRIIEITFLVAIEKCKAVTINITQ
jgi:hypothetical protein